MSKGWRMTDDGPGTFLLYVSRRIGTRAVGRETAHVRRQFRAITRRKEPEGKSTHSVIHSRPERTPETSAQQQKATRRFIFCRCGAWTGGGWRK